MNGKTVTIPLETYNVLRGTFIKAVEILDSLGKELDGGVKKRTVVKAKPKETKQQGVNRFKDLIETGQRAKKPDYLKK